MKKNISSSTTTAILILPLSQVSLYLIGDIFSSVASLLGYYNLIFPGKHFTLANFYDDFNQLLKNCLTSCDVIK